MSTQREVAEQAAERQGLQISNRVLTWALGVLFLLAQSMLTYMMTTAAAEIKQTNITLTEVLTNQKVQQIENRVMNDRLGALEARGDKAEKIHDSLGQRIGSLEQRQAITDAFMGRHK